MKIEYPMRLNTFLARSGFGSRRSCEVLIDEGRVAVNTKVVTQQGYKVELEDVVTVDGALAEVSTRRYYFALHKPRGYVCTNYDPNEKLFARDLIDIPDKALLFHVGRLDKDSSGLILFTNDGQLAQKVAHPSGEIDKEYLVLTREPLRRADLEEALKGVTVEESEPPYTIKRFDIRSKRWVSVILDEGRNRQVRKIFDYFGYTVERLIRIRIGTIELGDLAVGKYRALSRGEMQRLLEEKS